MRNTKVETPACWTCFDAGVLPVLDGDLKTASEVPCPVCRTQRSPTSQSEEQAERLRATIAYALDAPDDPKAIKKILADALAGRCGHEEETDERTD